MRAAPDIGGVHIRRQAWIFRDGSGFSAARNGLGEGGIGMVNDRMASALARMSGDGGTGGEQQNDEPPKHRLKLSPSQVAASSLAACCSALVASFLGIEGTIGGAAIGSVVATTGTAVYGHALRKGSTKIVRRLGSSTVVASQGEPQAPTPEWTQTELPLTPEAEEADADTDASADEEAAAQVGSDGSWPRPAKTKYRKPIALAAALLVVFGTAIIVGLLAGGPIRQAGTGYNFTRPQPAATQHSATASAGATGSSSASAGTSPSASASASAAASGSATSSGLASPSQGQGAAVSQAPTG